MEGVVQVLLQALPVLGSAAASELSKRTIGALWDGVKQAVGRRFADSPAPELIDRLRAHADDPPAREAAAARLSAMNLDADPEVQATVRQLAAELKRVQGVGAVTMNAQTMYAPMAQNVGTVNFNFTGKE